MKFLFLKILDSVIFPNIFLTKIHWLDTKNYFYIIITIQIYLNHFMNSLNCFCLNNQVFYIFDFKLFMKHPDLIKNILNCLLNLTNFRFIYVKTWFQEWKAQTNHYIWHMLEFFFKKSTSSEIKQMNYKCFEACSGLKIYWFCFQLFGNIIARSLTIYLMMVCLSFIMPRLPFY